MTNDTLILTATAAALNAASDAQLVNVETVQATTAKAGVVINVSNQTEGFTIIGSTKSNVLAGGVGANSFVFTVSALRLSARA
jgi:hypothetical protein